MLELGGGQVGEAGASTPALARELHGRLRHGCGEVGGRRGDQLPRGAWAAVGPAQGVVHRLLADCLLARPQRKGVQHTAGPALGFRVEPPGRLDVAPQRRCLGHAEPCGVQQRERLALVEFVIGFWREVDRQDIGEHVASDRVHVQHGEISMVLGGWHRGQ